MGIFKNPFKQKKQKKQGPTRRPLYDVCEETNYIVDSLAQMLRDLNERLNEQRAPGKKPQEAEQQEESGVWEPFVAYSPMIDALGQEITEDEGEETDYAEYALAAEYAAEIAATGGDATDE